MKVLGLTGSIAMGKTTAATKLRYLGLQVHDADACVHRLFARGGIAVDLISAHFPDVVRDHAVDRVRLGQLVFGNAAALAKLEALVHPLVGQDRDRFLARNRRYRTPMVVLDVPLLFESQNRNVCDIVMVVSAPAFLQRQRAFLRPGMTIQKLNSILARQMSDTEKRRRSDIVIPTGLGYAWMVRKLKRYLVRRRKQRL